MTGDVGAAIERALRENGLSDQPDKYDSSIHSWRCEHPDRYGPCTCFAELVTDLAAGLARIEQARAGEGALRERVEALAGEWEQRASKCRRRADTPTVTLGQQWAYTKDAGVYSDAARALRAALTTADPT